MKAELIKGVVFVTSPVNLAHSDYDVELGFVLSLYRRATPGSEPLHNATLFLGDESEPQPDLGLRILPTHGGQSRNTANDRYVEGAPEMLAEIANSTRAIDMHGKRDDYIQAGVIEYMVVCVEEREVYWFHFPSAGRLKVDRVGVCKSRVFPGLWIHIPSLLAFDSARLEDVARQGLASRAHEKFVRKLVSTHRKRSGPASS